MSNRAPTVAVTAADKQDGLGAKIVLQRIVEHADRERASALAESGRRQQHDG